MNISNLLWGLFKFIYLPAGLFFGLLHDSEALVNLSLRITNTVGALIPFNVDGTLPMTIIMVVTSPAALIAWMIPEGSSLVFLLPAAILGQYGLIAALLICCFMLAPPRFLQEKAED